MRAGAPACVMNALAHALAEPQLHECSELRGRLAQVGPTSALPRGTDGRAYLSPLAVHHA